MRVNKNIRVNKIIGVDKIYTSTKYWRQQNLGSTKTWHRQKAGADRNMAKTQENLLSFRLGRICSWWLLLDPAEDLLLLPFDGVALCACSHQVRHSLRQPCFYGRTLSSTVPAYCTGPPCWKCPKLWRWQNIGVRLKFPDFCSQASYQKVVTTQMFTIPVQYQFLCSQPPN